MFTEQQLAQQLTNLALKNTEIVILNYLKAVNDCVLYNLSKSRSIELIHLSLKHFKFTTTNNTEIIDRIPGAASNFCYQFSKEPNPKSGLYETEILNIEKWVISGFLRNWLQTQENLI